MTGLTWRETTVVNLQTALWDSVPTDWEGAVLVVLASGCSSNDSPSVVVHLYNPGDDLETALVNGYLQLMVLDFLRREPAAQNLSRVIFEVRKGRGLKAVFTHTAG